MLAHYRELQADLDRIRNYLGGVSSRRASREDRQFAYVASLSTLYATFEIYAERIAFRFAQLLLSTPQGVSPGEMEKLRKRYVANAAALLGQRLGSGRYGDVTELDVARSLASCLDDSEHYELREEILTHHGSNLRWDTLGSLFAWAVGDLRELVGKSDVVQKWTGDPDPVDSAAIDLIDSELKLMVQRRNEIAHNGLPDEILSADRMIEVINYIEVISLGLIATLGHRILEPSLGNGQSVQLGLCTEYYRENRVVVIGQLTERVALGDIVWSTNGRKTRWGTVLGIQLDGESVPHASIGEEAGIEVDFQIPRNAYLNRWCAATEDLSPPPANLFGNRGPISMP